MIPLNRLVAWCRSYRTRRAVAPIRRTPPLSLILLEDRLTPATQTFTPNTFADVFNPFDSVLSLREAVTAATDAAFYQGDDAVVQLSAGTYELSIAGRDEDSGGTGDLDLQTFGHTVTIQGAGAGTTVVDANQIDRVFHVLSSTSTVVFKNLMITGGLGVTPSGTAAAAKVGGGGIANYGGKLTLDGVAVTGNAYAGVGETATGGGGVASFGGTVTIANSTISSNAVTVGGFGKSYNLNGADGGEDEDGTAGKPGPAAGVVAGGGFYGFTAFTTVTNSTLANNSITGGTGHAGGNGGAGGEGSFGSGGSGGDGAGGGAGGAAYGAAAYAIGGRLTLTGATVTDNTARGGTGGSGGGGGGGDGFSHGGTGGTGGAGGNAGGAVYAATNALLTVGAGTRVEGNTATGGAGGTGGPGANAADGGRGGAGGSALGAGVSIVTGTGSVTGATVKENTALGGAGGNGGTGGETRSENGRGGNGGTGGQALGGGFYFDSTFGTLNATYVLFNSATGGKGGAGGAGGHGENGSFDVFGSGGANGNAGGNGGTGGSAGGGGGYAKGRVTIARSTFDSNGIVGGAPGDGGDGGRGGDGGTGILQDGSGGSGGAGGNGGSAGTVQGGGLYVSGGNGALSNVYDTTIGYNSIPTPTLTSKGGAGGGGGDGTPDGGSGAAGSGWTGTATASGGGLYVFGSVGVINSTIAYNSTGVAGGNSNVQLKNTIVAGNGPLDVTGTFISGGSNLVGVGTPASFTLGTTEGNAFGSAASPLDPGIDTVLANNGGATPTFKLLPTSRAIDAGQDSVTQTPLNITTDQRGVARLSGAHVDVGAFERQSDVSLTGELQPGEDVPLFTDVTLLLTVNVGQDAGTPNVSLTYTFSGPLGMYTPNIPTGWTWDWIRDGNNLITGLTASKSNVAPGTYTFPLVHSINFGVAVGTQAQHHAAITHTFADDTNPNNQTVDLVSRAVNPVPVLVGLDQTSAREGSAPTFDIRVSPVVPGAQVYFNDVAIPTTYVNTGRLRVSVPPALVVDDLDALITVENPGPGGGFAEGTLGFTVYNLPPTATFSQERWTVAARQLSFSLTNPTDASPADDFRYSFATSLAGLATTFEAAGAVNSQLLSFPTAGDHTAYGRIFDKDGGYTDYTATVHVAAANAAPVLSGANELAAIAEDDTTNGGTLVSALLAGKATDSTGGPLGIAVVGGTTTASGTWQFSTNGSTTWTDFGPVVTEAATLLGPTDKVRFVPAANFNGQVPGFVFRAWDRTDGRQTGERNAFVVVTGGGTAFSAATATAGVRVWVVNDTPSIIDEDLGGVPQGVATVIPFSTLLANDCPALQGQSPDENGQTLTVDRIDSTVNCTAVIVGDTVVVTPTGTGTASFVYWASDDGTTNGAADPQADVARASFTVVPAFVSGPSVNDGVAPGSAAAWGDYDNDGDLDVLVVRGSFNNPLSDTYVQRNNGDGTFTVQTAVGLPSLYGYGGRAAWGDYDGDGWLDVALAGDTTMSTLSTPVWVTAVYRNNHDGTFTQNASPFVGVAEGHVSWADFDNDGDLDLLVSGVYDLYGATATTLYENQGGGVFADSGLALPQVGRGTAAWGDYDNDGFPDLFLSGTEATIGTFSSSFVANHTVVLHNDHGTGFTDSGAALVESLPGSYTTVLGSRPVSNHSGAVWGDYDTDGDLDLLVAGVNGAGSNLHLYRNDGGGFATLAPNVPVLYGQTITWCDYDNDGDLDIVTGGIVNGSFGTPGGGIYVNNGGSFTRLPGFTFGYGQLAWGDADNDGDPELIVGDALLKNNRGTNTPAANTPPAAPTSLAATIDTLTSAVLSWAAPTGDVTPPAGLTFNLRVGTTTGGSDVLAATARPDGTLTVPQAGSVLGTSWRLTGLTTGTRYYWSVQAVDAGLAGSAFAAEGSFVPTTPPTTGNTSVAATEDTDTAFRTTDFPFSDADAGDTLQFVKVVTLPAKGTLKLNGSPVAAGQEVGVADIAAGRFTYRASANESGSGYTSFTFRVGDGGAFSTSAATMTVGVTAVADAPVVTVSPASGLEDAAIPLSILVQLADTDGSETLGFPVTIRGVPTGATLSAGTDLGGGVWSLTHAQLAGLTITPSADSDAGFTLTASATATESSTGATATGSSDITVSITAAADAPTLSVSNASGAEGAVIPLSVAAGLADADGSEVLAVVVTGVPAWTTLSAGTEGPAGIWTLTPAQLTGLTITLPDDGTFDLTVTATATEAANGATASTPRTLRVTANNVAPTAALSAAPAGAIEGTTVSLTGSASDPSSVDSASLSYAWAVTRNGAAYTSGTGTAVTFTPDDNGTYVVTLTATDKGGGADDATATIGVGNVNPALGTVTNSGPTDEGSPVTISVSASDAAGANDPLAVEYDFDSDGTYETTSPTHTFADGGSYTIGVRVSDGDGGVATGSTTVTVNNVAPTGTFSNDGPVAEGSPVTVSFTGLSDPSAPDTTAGFAFSFGASVGDLALTAGGASPAAAAAFTFPDDGVYTFYGRVFDTDGGFTTYSTTVTVTNASPVVTAPLDQTADEGATAAFDLGSFTDAGVTDGPWVVTVSWGDSGADSTFTTAVRVSLGTLAHAYADNGTYTVTVSAADADGDTGSRTFTVTVANLPPAPTITGVPANTVEASAVQLGTSATDPGSGDLGGAVYAWSVAKNGSSFAGGTGASFQFTPDDDGTYLVTLTATDKDGASAATTARLTVGNAPPVVASVTNDGPADEGDVVTVTATASDAAGVSDPLTYEFDFDGDGTYEVSNATGVATHTYAGSGSYTVHVRVTDGDGGTATGDTVALVVNVAPVLSGVPGITVPAAEEVPYTFTATAADVATDTLTFSLVGALAGAAIDPVSGVFTWTPTEDRGPGSYTFAVAVSDGTDETRSAVTIDVAEANRPPALAALPTDLRGTVRSLTSFRATATDPDRPANALAFSLVGAPAGATIGPASGEFTWTPGPTQTGTHTFAVRVTDGGGVVAEKTMTLRVDPARADQSHTGRFVVSNGPTVTTYAAAGPTGASATPFPGASVRAAAADVTGDGVADLIAVTGPGSRTRLAVFDGASGGTVWSTTVFEAGFTGGGFVAAGDVDGDGRADVVVSADDAGAPRVTVFSGATGAVLADFFGIEDSHFRGGARVAVGDFNGDRLADLVVAAGVGGGPRVSLFDGASLRPGVAPRRLVGDFFVFEQTLRDGVFLTAGDVNGDGRADLIVGGGPGGAPRVLAVDGAALVRNGGESPTVLVNFFAGSERRRSGVWVAAKDLDGDARADLVVRVQSPDESKLKLYLGRDLGGATPAPYRTFDDPFDYRFEGIFVG